MKTTAAQEELRAILAENSDCILELYSQKFQLNMLEVTQCLPENCWSMVDGKHFIRVLKEASAWGKVTTIVHTDDVIVEFCDDFPQGSEGHGFYNLTGSTYLGGHLRANHCAHILFVERLFMGIKTASLQFFNQRGNSMFKVYLSRDDNKQIIAEQLQAFRQLADELNYAGELV